MPTAATSRRPAFLCAFIFLVCVLAAHPVAEIGIVDDWSYVQSARILAQTGHIVYNGWAAPILGWQLFFGALFAKLFGPSFTAIRASTLCIALITTVLTQRTFVRAGVNSRNATIGTLVLVLSPLVLPLAFNFMTEVDSLFCIILCIYACLRALQAQSNRAILAWLTFAALSNAAGGTVRQNVWLGVLIMFPCTVWLLRRRPRVLLISALLYAASAVIIYATLQWFAQQPYSVPEHLFEGIPNRQQLIHVVFEFLSLFLSFSLLLLPVLIAFVPVISPSNRRTTAVLAAGGAFCITSVIYLVVAHPHRIPSLIAPFRGNCVTEFGLLNIFPIKGQGPVILGSGPRLLLTIVLILALLCFFAFMLTGRRADQSAQSPQPESPPISYRNLLVLLGPFTLAYIALLLPRGLRGDVFDRYCLFLVPIALIFLLRIYQDRVRPNLPIVSTVFVALFALYAVAGTHDSFSLARAKAAAISELRAAGIPDTSIDGGFEHNGMAQIQKYGTINDPQVHMPAAEYIAHSPVFPPGCQPDRPNWTPAIVPGYALSYDPNACGGLSRFAPVTFHVWLAAATVPIYIVNTVRKNPSVVSPSAQMGDKY